MTRRRNGEETAAKQKKNDTWYRALRIEGTSQRKFFYGKTKEEVDRKCKEFIKEISVNAYLEIKKQSVEDLNWLTTYKK